MSTMLLPCPRCKHEHILPTDTEWCRCDGCAVVIAVMPEQPEQLELFPEQA